MSPGSVRPCDVSNRDRTSAYALNGPSFVAFVYVIDGGDAIRPLTFREGRRVEVHAKSEALALNSAMLASQERFGAMTEPAHGCQEPAMPPIAEPLHLAGLTRALPISGI